VKIVIVVLFFPPKWLAGTEIATYNTAKYLAKNGHEVHVITSLDEGLPKESINEGFHIHRIRFLKVRFLGIAIFWLQALLLLKRLKPDVVHGQDMGMTIVGFLSKCILKKPYVTYGRGTDIYFSKAFKKSISKLILKNADAAIALTEDMKKKMRETYDRHIFVIPNGIELERFHKLPRNEMRIKLGIKADEKIILFVGRLHPVKGVKHLIKAVNVVRQKHKAKLLLVGKGPEQDRLKKLVEQLHLEDYVKFMGPIPNEKIPWIYAAADILVLPSLSEGFPVTILEAMASGLPIIATRVGGLPEVIEEEYNGFLVEPENPKQIAEKISLLLQNDKLRENISKNNRRKAKGYSWQSIVQQLEDIYRKISPSM
jgi:N-acetyl-alpha-D-glucosaminyl L-malate synthase BshA